MSLRISSFEIHQTYGTEHFRVGEFSALRVHGRNGAGKSSILKALGYVLDGGTDPSVIRRWKCGDLAHGPSVQQTAAGVDWVENATCAECGGRGYVEADKSVVALGLSDGTTISKTTRPKRARRGGDVTGYTVDLEINQPDGTIRKAPQTYLKELAEVNSVDPSVLLRIDSTTAPGRAKLAAELLRLVPVLFQPEEVGDESLRYLPVGEYKATLPLPLDALKKISAAITEERRRVGQTKEAATGAVVRLQKSLPESLLAVTERHMAGVSSAKEEEAAKAALETAEQERRDVESAISDRKKEIETEKERLLGLVKQEWSTAVAETNKSIDEQIKALESQRSIQNEANRAELGRKSLIIAQTAQDGYRDLDAESKPVLEAAIAKVAEFKARVNDQARASFTRQEIEVQELAARDASIKYDRLSAELQRLEGLRLDKLKNLPVAGLVVENGIPSLDGIEWQNVNLARRVEAVIQICTQNSGKLPLIMIDDAEHLDDANSRLIRDGLIEAGYQVICANVSDADRLTIEVK